MLDARQSQGQVEGTCLRARCRHTQMEAVHPEPLPHAYTDGERRPRVSAQRLEGGAGLAGPRCNTLPSAPVAAELELQRGRTCLCLREA